MTDKSLERVRRGCFRIADKSEEPPSEDTLQRRRLEAHQHGILSTSKGRMVYSHTSAACLQELNLWRVNQQIHATQGFAISAHGHGLDVQSHCFVLPPDQIVVIDGFRTTSVERTVVDCGRILSHQQGLIVADHALRRGADRENIAHILKSLAGHRGISRAREVMEKASGLSESPGETLTRHFFISTNLPTPIEQFVVQTRLGSHRLDFALPELELAFEFDGKTKYFDYQPTSDALFQERRREKALTEMGWQFLRIEWADLFRAAELKARVLAAITAAESRRR
ncbi:hypothetical protein [Arthrobacter roseus]|uniref:hypothetical protein n=1 Tax=Arthrobacter roseus TaxID=136274 RepID=UPI0019654F68|nr:very-short-patch-repair endonuclease [Arthrobacter roseus]